MKYLQAKGLPKATKATEHKMQPGVRSDQRQDQLQDARTLRRSNPDPKHKPEIRDLAAQLGVDLDTVTGSGKDGEVLAKDVRKHKLDADAKRDADKKASEKASEPPTTPPTP